MMATKTYVKVEEKLDSASDSSDSGDDDNDLVNTSSLDQSQLLDNSDILDKQKQFSSNEECEDDSVSDSTLDDKNSDLDDDICSDNDNDVIDENQLGDQRHGLASVMEKIMNKNVTGAKSVILAKAKTDREIQWKRRKDDIEKNTELEGESKKQKINNEEYENKFRDMEQLNKRKKWEEMGRVKPSVLDREVEKKLQRIATRGVVQLFNAVKKQQKFIDEKIKEVGTTETKREKVLNSMSKGDFLDMLKGSSISNVTNEPAEKTTKDSLPKAKTVLPDKNEKQTLWTALRDDFMMNSKMKDWDKASSEEESNQEDSGSDSE